MIWQLGIKMAHLLSTKISFAVCPAAQKFDGPAVLSGQPIKNVTGMGEIPLLVSPTSQW
jgi:hypothetical protein